MSVGVPIAQHEALYAAYVDEMTASVRGFQLRRKRDSRFCRLIDTVLKVLTFGGQDRFMTEYITTFGGRIYVPAGWDDTPPGERYCILRHEIIHVRQFRRLTWPGITLVYVLFPLPVGLAAGRAWLEWEGYRETLKSTWQVYGEAEARSVRLKKSIVRRFTGPDYGWMWLRGRTISNAIDRYLETLAADPPPALPPPALSLARTISP
ncbi:MAG: hypothetical protein ACI9MR_000335 [Myxococcota bacterium]|jgi:hypothetical protein